MKPWSPRLPLGFLLFIRLHKSMCETTIDNYIHVERTDTISLWNSLSHRYMEERS